MRSMLGGSLEEEDEDDGEGGGPQAMDIDSNHSPEPTAALPLGETGNQAQQSSRAERYCCLCQETANVYFEQEVLLI